MRRNCRHGKVKAALKAIAAFKNFTILVCGLLLPFTLEAAEWREKAEVEGKVVFYTTTATAHSKALMDSFMRLYPKIDAQFVRTGSAQLAEKVLAEARAGKHIWDVILSTPFYMQVFKNKGLLSVYDSPERRHYREGYKDQQGLWTSTYTNYAVFGYNTRHLSREDIPKSHHDLLKPEWRGQIGMESKPYEWFATIVKHYGEDAGLSFMRRLAQQQLQLRNGRSLLAQLVAAGEMKGALACFSQNFENVKLAGAPVEWVALDPVVAYLHPMGLSVKAPHPNAGRLFIDFILSKRGQEVVRSGNLIPDRIDTPPDPPRLIEGIKPAFPAPDVYEDLNRYIKLFNKIFWRR